MKLLIDVGNSRLKWAWLERGELGGTGCVAHRGRYPRRTIGVDGTKRPRPSEILLASVASAALSAEIAAALEQEFGTSVRVAEAESAAAGVINGYIEPRQLGVDRWLALLAAFARYRKPVCVVDAGTALTVDGVAKDGRHLGGLIVPGPALMRQALLQATGGIGHAAKLVSQGSAADPPFWGRDTEACIQLGSLHSMRSLVESHFQALTRSGEADGVLVVTGGHARALLAGLSVTAEHRPLLVLEGLALRYGGQSS